MIRIVVKVRGWANSARCLHPNSIVVAAALLAGCSDPVADAEKRYAIVEKSGDADVLCAEGKKLASAYLDAGNGDKYSERKVSADIACDSRRMNEQDGTFRMADGTDKHFEADNMDIPADNER